MTREAEPGRAGRIWRRIGITIAALAAVAALLFVAAVVWAFYLIATFMVTLIAIFAESVALFPPG